MTDLASALADASRLTPYGGRDVLRTGIAIRNAGDGLSQAMAIEPEELAIGSTVYVVLECVVHGHEHEPIKDTAALELKQILKAGTATLIEADVVREAIQAQADRIKRAREAADGIGHLPTAEDVENAIRDHANGLHSSGLVPGCPECEAEVQAAQEEAEAPKPKRSRKRS